MEPFNQENVMQAAHAFIDGLPCHARSPYPDARMPFRNERIGNMLLAAYSFGGGSELTATTQYMDHAGKIRDRMLADMVFCISLSEMRHLGMIGTMIETLGGDLRYWGPNRHYWSGGIVSYGDSDCERLSLDILAEQNALSGYQELLREIRYENDPSLARVEDVIKRIMEDEVVHLNLFSNAYRRNCQGME